MSGMGLEERVTALEERVDQLTLDSRYAVHTSLAARDAHLKNIELLNALRQTQVEQGGTLKSHGTMLAEHSAVLAEHSAVLAEHSAVLNEHSVLLNEHTTILGKLLVGMHAIESLLRNQR
jgi:hypothetical protein